jgi:hypothetical protein
MTQRSNVPKTALELRFDAAATPARVEATAQFIDRMLKAADPQLPDDCVTLVVSNYSTVASLHAWTPAGSDVLRRCERFLQSPLKEIRRDPSARQLALALAKAAPAIAQFRARVAKPRAKKKTIAIIDEKFIDGLERLTWLPTTTGDPEPPMAGSTQVYSPIYRVGRLDEGKEVRARIRVDDRPHDVLIENGVVGVAFDVAKTGAIVPITIDGGWSRDQHNTLVLDASRTRITRIGAGWEPIAGADFLDAIHAALPDAFADLTDVLPGDAH